jgi:hypothetical protein
METIYYSKQLVLLLPHHSPVCHVPEDHNVNISVTDDWIRDGFRVVVGYFTDSM